jgi:hypothetical protein
MFRKIFAGLANKKLDTMPKSLQRFRILAQKWSLPTHPGIAGARVVSRAL